MHVLDGAMPTIWQDTRIVMPYPRVQLTLDSVFLDAEGNENAGVYSTYPSDDFVQVEPLYTAISWAYAKMGSRPALRFVRVYVYAFTYMLLYFSTKGVPAQTGNWWFFVKQNPYEVYYLGFSAYDDGVRDPFLVALKNNAYALPYPMP